MNKKVFSIILLCVLFALLIGAVAIFVGTCTSFAKLKVIEPTEDSLPGASVLASVLVALSLWIGLIVGELMISSVGFVVSAINVRIAQNIAIKRISNGFLAFYSAVAILTVGFAVFLMVRLG